MKKNYTYIAYILASIILFITFGCIKKPGAIIHKPIEYSLQGGLDMTALFDIYVTFVNEKQDTVQQKITHLPWSKKVNLTSKTPADMQVRLKSKNPKIYKESYHVGLEAEIMNLDKTKGLTQNKMTRADNQFETFRFSVKMPSGVNSNDLSVSIPPLKYNKQMAFSYIADDNVVGAYARLWRRASGKWIDNIEFFHMGVAQTSGYLPNNTLGYTDGCGTEKRFPVGVSISPNVWNQWNPNGIIDESSTGISNPYITWEELRTIIDFGGAVYQHNIDEQTYDKESKNEVLKGFNDDIKKTIEKLGYRIKTLAQPYGNAVYLEAAMESPDLQFYRTNQLSGNLIYLNNEMSLFRKYTYSGFTDDINAKLGELKQQSESPNPYLVCMTTHRIGDHIIPFLEKVNDLYGKDGLDNLWYATLDEIYEYSIFRNEAQITQSVDGNIITYEVRVPLKKDFQNKDLSFLIKGLASKAEIKPLTDNITGFSSGLSIGNTLINVNFNPRLTQLAEKYTARYEVSMTTESRDDANYFISQLKESLRSTYLSRIMKTDKIPFEIKTFILNNGNSTALYGDIYVKVKEMSHNPDFYRIGLTSDLSKIEWQKFTTNDILYDIKESIGVKNIYIQYKYEDKESNVLSAEIQFVDKMGVLNIPKHHAERYMNDNNNLIINRQL